MCKCVEFTVVQCLCHTRDVCLNVLISFSLRSNRVLHKDEFSFLNLKDISLQNIKSLPGLFCWMLVEHSDLLICWVFIHTSHKRNYAGSVSYLDKRVLLMSDDGQTASS